MDTSGTLALVGGDEWTEGCTFDASLLAASGGTEVMVLPTAAAYQHPERVVCFEWVSAAHPVSYDRSPTFRFYEV